MAEAMCCAMGIEAASAGLNAPDGIGASANAVLVMRERGLDLTCHRAKTVNESMLRQADIVVCMTDGHARTLAARYPAYRGKITTMPDAIPDPYGGTPAEYRLCADAIERGLSTLQRMGRL